MKAESTECDEALSVLREQGLTVRLHNRQNNSWHIADGGLYGGYVVTDNELAELKRTDNLNIRGIKSLVSSEKNSEQKLAGNEPL